jgi:hypothetical protein
MIRDRLFIGQHKEIFKFQDITLPKQIDVHEKLALENVQPTFVLREGSLYLGFMLNGVVIGECSDYFTLDNFPKIDVDISLLGCAPKSTCWELFLSCLERIFLERSKLSVALNEDNTVYIFSVQCYKMRGGTKVSRKGVKEAWNTKAA